MTLNKKDWEKSKEAWRNIKKQAEIDLEQSNYFLDCVEAKIKEFPEEVAKTYDKIPIGVA